MFKSNKKNILVYLVICFSFLLILGLGACTNTNNTTNDTTQTDITTQSDTYITLIEENQLNNVEFNWVTKIVKYLIEKLSFGGYIAVGIIFFTFILKIIPLPLDIYSRVSQKKNALKMEKMRPELERLQKQYANNKELYNQKMMALYKKEGYSTFSACLPSLFTLVFFLIVFNGFNRYSSYANLSIYNNMALEYNKQVYSQVLDTLNSKSITVLENEDKNIIYINSIDDSNIFINLKDGKVNTYNTATSSYTFNMIDYLSKEEQENIVKNAQDKAADIYFDLVKQSSFLWVKNIWISDTFWNKAFISDTSRLFTYSSGCSSKTIENDLADKTKFEIVTGSSKLDEVKNQPNGYLILVLLSIGSMLLSQFIASKQQKTQMELQSVDGANGTAAQTSKMMMWMMPVMFGFFAFMYSTAFSIYMIISTLFSTLSMLIINKLVEKKFMKTMELEQENNFKKRFSHLSNKEDNK